MACEPIIVHGVTQKVMAGAQDKLRSFGMDMPTMPSGTISQMGVKASYIWDEASATLTVTVHDKPMFISCSMIEGRIRDAVKMLQ
ncbi:MAG TPA: hypothetical protein VFH43_11570 [Candidatus Kapabacteria bacterium]|nr:hypothetical protein [Candidatus Kapabacteria bacterium]